MAVHRQYRGECCTLMGKSFWAYQHWTSDFISHRKYISAVKVHVLENQITGPKCETMRLPNNSLIRLFPSHHVCLIDERKIIKNNCILKYCEHFNH